MPNGAITTSSQPVTRLSNSAISPLWMAATVAINLLTTGGLKDHGHGPSGPGTGGGSDNGPGGDGTPPTTGDGSQGGNSAGNHGPRDRDFADRKDLWWPPHPDQQGRDGRLNDH